MSIVRGGEAVDSSAFIVLGLGDSVINGGVLTDQDSLATTRLSELLSKLIRKKVQVLNVSAGSWGPDNCEAYLNRYPLIKGLHYMDVSDYRDGIHLNEQGQRKLSEMLYQWVIDSDLLNYDKN